jgi:predicted amidohydrolase
MRAACLQLSVKPCQLEDNLRRALEIAQAALQHDAEILVFPELFLTGFCHDPAFQYSISEQPASHPGLAPFKELAEENGCLIIGSIRCSRLNLGFCLDKYGLEIRPKIHPFGEEKAHFDGGSFISPVNTEWGLVGLLVCYDLRFPEMARSLAIQGADFLVTVAQFPSSRREQWRVLSQARAIENQMPHLACNWADGGGSIIIDSRGKALAEAGDGQQLILADIDLSERDLFRREIPCFSDRRPEIYGGEETERPDL